MSGQKWTTKHESPQDGWEVDYDFDDDDEWPSDYGSAGVFDESGAAVCFVVSVPYDAAKLERNAIIISAAPDMEEALKFVSQFLAEGSNDPAERARAIAMIDGALIKAGG